MKIAVASCGLGHVARGIESWARDTAAALAERGIDVTLFAGAPVGAESGERRAEVGGRRSEVECSAASPLPLAPARIVVLPCLRRSDPRAEKWARRAPAFTWRWGWKDTYGIEQFTFWLRLWRRLRSGQFDILHVQDPLLALWCYRLRRAGWLRTREILAHGTREPAAFLGQLPFVQHLAPWHLEQALGRGESIRCKVECDSRENKREDGRQRTEDRGLRSEVDPATGATAGSRSANYGRYDKALASGNRPDWGVIPNFVDTSAFAPLPETRPGESVALRGRLREKLGIPAEARVIGTVGALLKSDQYKRYDYLFAEFGSFLKRNVPGGGNTWLLVAGARSAESDDLIRLGETLAPGRLKIVSDLSRERMPDFYRAMDVFVLASLFEMMPVAGLEAMASGLPVVFHRHPLLEWVAGDGGVCIDMSAPGALAEYLARLTPDWVEQTGRKARSRAERVFARKAVIDQYVAYYRQVMAAKAVN